MDDETLAGRILVAAREVAKKALAARGTVPPFAVTLDRNGKPDTYMPSDDYPKAPWDDLLGYVVTHMAERARLDETGAVALVTWLEAGARVAFGVQVETRTAAIFLVYPCERGPNGWTTGDPATVKDLLVDPVLCGQA